MNFDADAVRHMGNRGNAWFDQRAKNAMQGLVDGKEVSEDDIDHLISEAEKNRDRYADAGREPERSYAQNIIDAAKYRKAAAAEPEAPAEPEGRTQAVENVYDKIEARAKELRAAGKRAEARKLGGRADDIGEFLDKAQAAHEAGDAETRDRWLRDADRSLDGMAADGHKDLADELRRDIAGNRARFEADDNAVDPMDLDEGMNAIFDAADPILRDLRKQGPEGRKKARALQANIDSIEEALENSRQRRR